MHSIPLGLNATSRPSELQPTCYRYFSLQVQSINASRDWQLKLRGIILIADFLALSVTWRSQLSTGTSAPRSTTIVRRFVFNVWGETICLFSFLFFYFATLPQAQAPRTKMRFFSVSTANGKRSPYSLFVRCVWWWGANYNDVTRRVEVYSLWRRWEIRVGHIGFIWHFHDFRLSKRI